MNGHGLGVMSAVGIPHSNAERRIDAARKILDFFHDDDFDLSTPAVIVTYVTDEDAVRARRARANGKILGIDGLKAINVDGLYTETRHVCNEESAAVSRIVDVINTIWKLTGHGQAAVLADGPVH
jgi:hypothetical protein